MSNVNTSEPEQLVLHNVNKETAGWYTCVVQNSIGIEYGSAWLKVVDGGYNEEMLIIFLIYIFVCCPFIH